MAEARRRGRAPKEAPTASLDQQQLVLLLDAMVRASIFLLGQLDDEAFARQWRQAALPGTSRLHALALLETLLEGTGTAPQGFEHAQGAVAALQCADMLAAAAFAPDGVRLGQLHWSGTHPAAPHVLPFRVTVEADAREWDSPLHRVIVARLHRWFPLMACRVAMMDADAWQEERDHIATLSPEAALFSEALVVGGTAAQMGEAFADLARVIPVLACCPGGVTAFGATWEVFRRGHDATATTADTL